MSIYQNGSLMGTTTNLTPQYDSSMPLAPRWIGPAQGPEANPPSADFHSDAQRLTPYAPSAVPLG
jgi:hypothetical protein